jgi:hypothetical protein
MDWAAQEAVADLVDEMGLRDRTLFVVNKVTETKSGLVDRAKEFFALRTKFPILVIKHPDGRHLRRKGRSSNLSFKVKPETVALIQRISQAEGKSMVETLEWALDLLDKTLKGKR